jgi:hypothetical protein
MTTTMPMAFLALYDADTIANDALGAVDGNGAESRVASFRTDEGGPLKREIMLHPILLLALLRRINR